MKRYDKSCDVGFNESVERLTQALAAAERSCVGIDAPDVTDRQAAVRWMKRAEAAEARVRDLDAALQRDAERVVDGWDEVHASLAAATALLERVVKRGPTRGDGSLNRDILDWFASQPAAPTRTEAELINETELVTLHDAQTGAPFVLSVREIRAELARRGLKP